MLGTMRHWGIDECVPAVAGMERDGMVRGVLLDFYGTLVEEDHANLQAIASAIHRDAPEETTVRDIDAFWYDAFFMLTDTSHGEAFRTQAVIGHTSLEQTIIRFGSTVDAAAAVAGQQRYWANPTLYDETIEFLRVVRDLGLVTCVVSNADRADVDSALSLHGLAVDHVVTSEDARHYKPHPRIFELAMEATGLASQDLVHIGDSWRSDVRGASNLGIRPVWLNRDGKTRPDDDLSAHEVTSLTDLSIWLQEQAARDG